MRHSCNYFHSYRIVQQCNGVHPNDNFAYVDAMTNRLNDSDLRLMRASVNDRPKELASADNEGGQIPNSYTNEQHMTNQAFEKKVSFSHPGRPS